jgi:hypothetical protein
MKAEGNLEGREAHGKIKDKLTNLCSRNRRCVCGLEKCTRIASGGTLV